MSLHTIQSVTIRCIRCENMYKCVIAHKVEKFTRGKVNHTLQVLFGEEVVMAVALSLPSLVSYFS